MHQVPIDEFIRRLHSHAEQGLSRAEAAVRLKREGPNSLTPSQQTSEFVKFLRQLTNLFALLLWCGAALYLKAVTAFFVAVILCQVANGLISKTSRQSLLQQGLFSNRWLLLGIAVELILAAAVVYMPILQP